MKTAFSSICAIALLMAMGFLVACDEDDVKDALGDPLTIEKTITIDDLEANGFTEDMRDIVFEQDIPNYDDFSDKIDTITIIDVEYRIYGNDGGDGAGVVFVSHYQDASNLVLLGEASVAGGVDMADFESLPLEPGALDFANELVDAEQFTVYFSGDAADIHFWVELVLKVEIELEP